MKKHAWAVILFLCVGVLATLAVSWISIIVHTQFWKFHQTSYINGVGPPDDRWSITKEKYFTGYTKIILKNWKNHKDEWPRVERISHHNLPNLSIGHFPATTYDRGQNCIEYVAGFPYACVFARWKTNSGFFTANSTAQGGLLIGYTDIDNHAVVLPYMPLWKGFALNSIIYAVLLYVFYIILLKLLYMFSRYRRMHKNLCPNCAYDIRGLTTCPECGEAVTPPKGVRP